MTIPVTPNQNLINPIKVTQIGPRVGFWKSIVLDVVTIGSALFFGYAYFSYLRVGLSLWFVFAAFLVYSACSVLQVFLTRKNSRGVFVFLAEAIGLLAFFVLYVSCEFFVVPWGVAFLIFVGVYFTSHSEIQNSMEVQFFGTTRSVLGKLTTGLLLFMVLIYAPQAQGEGAFIPRNDFKMFYDWSSGFMNNFYPGIPLSGSFSDLSSI